NYNVDLLFDGRFEVLTSKGNYSINVTSKSGSLNVSINSASEVLVGLLYDSDGKILDKEYIKLNLDYGQSKSVLNEEENSSTLNVPAYTGHSVIESPKKEDSLIKKLIKRVFGF